MSIKDMFKIKIIPKTGGPTQRAADRPATAIFRSSSVPNGVSAYTVVLGGRRLMRETLGGFLLI